MTTTVELTIRRLPAASLSADARLTSTASAAATTLAANVPVILDEQALLALELDPAAYGRELSRQLFADARLRDAWLKARAYAATDTLQLRLNLDASDRALHDLRWECLRDPETDQPIALHERVRLVRALDSADLTPVVVPPRPELRALVIVSNPSNLGDFRLAEVDVDGEVARARAALGDIPMTVLGDSPDRRATLANITSALRDAPPILILVAHGTIPEDTPLLWLEHDDGTADQVAGSDFVEAISRLSTRPLLLVLASCRSGGSGYGDTLSALGPRLTTIGVPAVLAFQGEVAMSTVKVLLRTLIMELHRDGQIDRALAAARGVLGDKRPWWQAVLWLRTDGRLWRETELLDSLLADRERTRGRVQEPVVGINQGTVSVTYSDQRQGVVIEGGTIHGNVIGQIIQQPPPSRPALFQLRAPTADFVGRKNEIAQLIDALTKGTTGRAAAAISGIRGMGGIGKSELALKVAHELREVFPDGQILIDLRGATLPVTPEEALKTLIGAFERGAKLPDNLSQLQSLYRSALNGKRVLILADGAKDVAQVRPLMPPSNCALLITSRKRFSLPGMAALDLGTLPPKEAEALLLNICPRIGKYVAEIARLCGYLPLALRVSAGLLATNDDRDVDHYSEQLCQERLKHLKEPDHSEDPQVSVEASLRLSYDALDFHAQFVLWQLALYPPGLTPEWIPKALQSAYDALEVVQFLYRCNLVEWDKTTKGYGLHDLVHEFARAQGQAFFEQEAIFRRQQGDVESTLSTLTWLVAFYNQQGDVERAIAAYKELGALARLIGDTHNEIGALDHIGGLLGHQGRTMDAIAFHEQALLQARELDSTEWLESSFLQLPPLYEKVGRWEDVVRLHKERRDRAHQRGDTKKEIDATWDIARTFDTAKQTPRAIETYEEYLALVRSRATEKPMSLVFGRLWNLYNQQGNYSQAARYLREYIDAHRTFLEGESTDLDMTKTLEDLEAQYHRLLKQAEHS